MVKKQETEDGSMWTVLTMKENEQLGTPKLCVRTTTVHKSAEIETEH